jgi:hypothetical protein
MMVVKFTHYSSNIHQILSYSHFSSSTLNLYPETGDSKLTNILYKLIYVKFRVPQNTIIQVYII